MYKFIQLLLILIIPTLCISQSEVAIELEDGEFIPFGHQFADNGLIPTYNSTTKTGRILSEDLKSLSAFKIEGGFSYNIYGMSYLSKHVFNSDDKYEFLISGSDPAGKSNYILMNDAGEILQDYGDNQVFLISLKTKNYLVKRKAEFNTSITPPQLKTSDQLFKIDGKFRKLEY